ncbi:MAG: glycoside hydrolase family protein [Cyanobacteria bacterium J06560_6]
MPKKTSTKNQSKPRAKKPRDHTNKADLGPIVLTALMFFGVALTLHIWSRSPRTLELLSPTDWVSSPLPLEMEGGDPYIRALMRTISAGESNTADPYRLLYGGERVKDLSMHPDECVTIVTGPNKGNCTTAAGRYQFLTTTWYREADNYHPERPKWYEMWEEPSFEPMFQDQVVHDWLSDPDAWGTDISQLLRDGEINLVLQTLSGTWTSLGYGIEDNSMSALLPQIYDEMLREELAEQG